MSRLLVDDVTLDIGTRRLFGGVCLALERGERVGLAAPSGAGKTELLRAIAGLRDAASGRFELDEKSRDSMPYPEWRRRVTYSNQSAVMLPGTVRDNLRRPFRYAAVGGAADEAALLGRLERLGVRGDVMDATARSLSIGEKQRVALVRTLSIKPTVVLLDEPTSALDAEATREVEAWLVELGEQEGLSALIVSHDRAQLERLTDRVVDLRPCMPNAAPEADRA